MRIPAPTQCQHFHTSHGDTNSSTWRIHAQGAFFWRPELWLPQSLGSILQLCNKCPQALEATKSPACCEEPWLSRDQESRLPHCRQDKLTASPSHIWWTCAQSLKRVCSAECFDSCRLMFKPGNLCHCSQPLLCPQTCLLGIRVSPCLCLQCHSRHPCFGVFHRPWSHLSQWMLSSMRGGTRRCFLLSTNLEAGNLHVCAGGDL